MPSHLITYLALTELNMTTTRTNTQSNKATETVTSAQTKADKTSLIQGLVKSAVCSILSMFYDLE